MKGELSSKDAENITQLQSFLFQQKLTTTEIISAFINILPGIIYQHEPQKKRLKCLKKIVLAMTAALKQYQELEEKYPDL